MFSSAIIKPWLLADIVCLCNITNIVTKDNWQRVTDKVGATCAAQALLYRALACFGPSTSMLVTAHLCIGSTSLVYSVLRNPYDFLPCFAACFELDGWRRLGYQLADSQASNFRTLVNQKQMLAERCIYSQMHADINSKRSPPVTGN